MAVKKEKEIKEKEKEEVKAEEPSVPSQVLMTQEEFDKRMRAKIRENINRVTRVIGMLAIIVIVVLGIIPLFCLSAFGLLFTKNIYLESWKGIGDSGAIDILCIMMGSPDGTYYPGMEWLGTVFMTLLMIAVILGMTYLLTYNIADLIQFFKGFFKSTKNLVIDISNVAKDGVEISKKEDRREAKKAKKAKKFMKKPIVEEPEETAEPDDKDLFRDMPFPEIKIIKDPEPEVKVEEKEKEKEETPRRKIKKEQNTGGYTDEQLDRLLRGEPLN